MSETEGTVQTGGKVLPPFMFYADFPEDWEHLGAQDKRDIVDFLDHLQDDPYDPRIIETSEKRGEYYAARSGSVIVYWKLARREGSIPNLLAPPDAIHILAVEPVDHFRWRGAVDSPRSLQEGWGA